MEYLTGQVEDTVVSLIWAVSLRQQLLWHHHCDPRTLVDPSYPSHVQSNFTRCAKLGALQGGFDTITLMMGTSCAKESMSNLYGRLEKVALESRSSE